MCDWLPEIRSGSRVTMASHPVASAAAVQTASSKSLNVANHPNGAHTREAVATCDLVMTYTGTSGSQPADLWRDEGCVEMATSLSMHEPLTKGSRPEDFLCEAY